MTHENNENTEIKPSATKQIGHSIIWAAMIIASSLVIKDEKAATTMLFLLIGGWIATVPYAGGFKNAMACERRMVRKFIKL